MAYYFLFPEKDATIYSHPDRDKMNTGHDEILELVKEESTLESSVYYSSRVLIQFKDSEIEDVIKNKSGNNYTASLQLFSTEHKNLERNHTIYTYLVSESWDEGTGRYSNLPTSSNGCSWLYRDNSINKSFWQDTDNQFVAGTTGNGAILSGGGTWHTSQEASQSFSNASNLDTNINVTSLIDTVSSSIFASSGFVHNGFLIKRTSSIEENPSSSFGELKYFSVDTHTIYSPRLAFKWDDSLHNSHSLAIKKGELSVSLYRNKEEYNQNEETTFRIHVRNKYPNRAFVTSSNFLNAGYFTSASYYSVRDAQTEDIIIPFDDNCTKLSSDDEGMYFKLFMNGLQPERYYRLLFKNVNDDGVTIYDNNYHFKVIR